MWVKTNSALNFVTLSTILQSIGAIPLLPTAEIKNVSCSKDLDSVSTSSGPTSFVVRCPADCAKAYYFVQGTTHYSPASFLCAAGIHAGVMTNAGGLMVIAVENKWLTPVGSRQNGVESKDYLEIHRSFTPGAVPASVLTAMRPTTTTTTTTTVHETLSASTESSTTPSSTTTISSTTSSISTQTSVKPTSTMPTKTVQQASTSKDTTPVTKSRLAKTELSTTTTTATTTTTTTSTPLTTSSSQQYQKLEEQNTKSDPFEDDFTIGPFVLEEQDEELGVDFRVWVGGFLGGAALLVAIPVLVYFWKTRRNRPSRRASSCGKHKSRGSPRGGVESCVCYVAVDSSVQALLNDPETCERPCELRDRLQDSDDQPDCAGHSGPQCDDCTGEKCAGLYDF